ncbi:hypothetical protein F2Q69_00004282 [Brassica cretica]|uniref:Uncharacterized protein n=1 Tax=Brassica cretica TaxID=69181 RepID=A0A8S9PBJ4_BRACR|nr:hypothetical protein F2Q69_00004282 [Brassica cretica]
MIITRWGFITSQTSTAWAEDATEPLTVIISPNNKKATNETHASPIAQLSTETPVFTPNQTHQMRTEATNETPASLIAQPSTEIPVFYSKSDATVFTLQYLNRVPAFADACLWFTFLCVVSHIFTLIAPSSLMVGESPIWTRLKSGIGLRGIAEIP